MKTDNFYEDVKKFAQKAGVSIADIGASYGVSTKVLKNWLMNCSEELAERVKARIVELSH